MSYFLDPETNEVLDFCSVQVDHLKGEKVFGSIEIPWYRLTADIIFCTDTRTIVVPKGYQFNGLSVPWILWPICPPGQPSAFAASAVHDFLYQTKIVSRKEADRIFLEAMLVNGYSKFGSYRNWTAVRTFGWMVY